MSFVDRNANNSQRLRRNAQRFRAGDGTGSILVTAPIANGATGLALTLLSTGGLQVSSSALGIKVDGAGTGLSLSSSGLKYTSPVTTKGDVLVFSSTPTRLPVGSNNTILVADSTQTTGLKWSGTPLLVSTQVGDNPNNKYALTQYEVDATIGSRNRVYTKYFYGGTRRGHVGFNADIGATGTLEMFNAAGDGIAFFDSIIQLAADGNTPALTADLANTRVYVGSTSDDGSGMALQSSGGCSLTGGGLRIGSTQVVTSQQAAIADASAGTIVTQFNTLLAALRTHGLIAT